MSVRNTPVLKLNRYAWIQFHLMAQIMFSIVLPILNQAAYSKDSVESAMKFPRDFQYRILQSHIIEIWNIHTAEEMLRSMINKKPDERRLEAGSIGRNERSHTQQLYMRVGVNSINSNRSVAAQATIAYSSVAQEKKRYFQIKYRGVKHDWGVTWTNND